MWSDNRFNSVSDEVAGMEQIIEVFTFGQFVPNIELFIVYLSEQSKWTTHEEQVFHIEIKLQILLLIPNPIFILFSLLL